MERPRAARKNRSPAAADLFDVEWDFRIAEIGQTACTREKKTLL